MSKRKRSAKDKDDSGEEDLVRQQDDEEDAEMQQRLSQRRSKESDRLGELYEQFIRVATPEQLERFEHWKRSRFPRAAMRRLMSDILGTSTERGAIVLATIAKMFVGDMVEGARERMTEMGETGPITPTQLRQAHRRAVRAGSVPSSTRHSPRLFFRSNCGA